jgi:XTP/dITP diphosphohydrolase
MKTLIFATGNPHKVAEVKAMIGELYDLKSLVDIGCREAIPETASTLEGNALLKARYVREHYDLDCFAEDSGLEIDALDGAPGVDSAHYAGPQRDAEDNMNLVLNELGAAENRTARFRTVIALVLNGEEHTFEGVVEGRILTEKRGEGGFGYDPIFQPVGESRSFAQMTADEKNAISHRGRALWRLMEFLRQDAGAAP